MASVYAIQPWVGPPPSAAYCWSSCNATTLSHPSVVASHEGANTRRVAADQNELATYRRQVGQAGPGGANQ